MGDGDSGLKAAWPLPSARSQRARFSHFYTSTAVGPSSSFIAEFRGRAGSAHRAPGTGHPPHEGVVDLRILLVRALFRRAGRALAHRNVPGDVGGVARTGGGAPAFWRRQRRWWGEVAPRCRRGLERGGCRGIACDHRRTETPLGQSSAHGLEGPRRRASSTMKRIFPGCTRAHKRPCTTEGTLDPCTELKHVRVGVNGSS